MLEAASRRASELSVGPNICRQAEIAPSPINSKATTGPDVMNEMRELCRKRGSELFFWKIITILYI